MLNKAELADQTLQTELTQYQQIAKDLYEELELSTAIFNTLNTVMVVLDPKGYIVRCNRAFEQITGYTFEKVKNKPLWDVFFLQDEKEWLKAVFSSIEVSLALAYENDWLIKDGSYRRIAWSYAPLLDIDGTIKYVIGTGIDISDRQKIEQELSTTLEELTVADEELRQQNEELASAAEALERERQRYQDLFDSAPDGYLVTTPEGLIQQANSAAGAMLGLSPMFLVGKPLANFILHSERRAFRLELLRLPQIERLQDWTVRLHPRNGKPFDAAFTVAAERGLRGNVVALRWLLRDNTSRQQALSAMRALHNELELGVQQRTAELAKANEVLQIEVNERRRTEAALRVSETRFRTIFEQSLLSMQILTPEGRTLQVNRAWEGLFGLGLPSVTDYVMTEDPQLVERGIMPCIHQGLAGEPTTIPPIFYDSNQTFGRGRECWVQAFMYPVQNDAGNYNEVVLMHQDVTALKQAEQLARGQTEAIARTLNFLATEPDLDKFLGQVLKALTEQLGARSAGFWLYEALQEITHLYVNYDDGEIKPAAQSSYPITSISLLLDQVFRQLLSDRKPYIFDDIANDPLLASYREYLLAKGIQSLLLVPLFLGDEYIGCFSVRCTEERCYQQEELELAQALAHQATLAIQLTRLAEQGRSAAVLEERNRLAREIHDTLAQSFTGILLQLSVAKRIADQQPEEAWKLIERVSEIAHEGLMEAQRSVWAMHPQAAEFSDLANTLTRSLEQITEHTSVRGSICIQGTPRTLPPDLGMNLLRIGQEAVINALKHAQAQSILLDLTFEADQVWLRVQDDGQGFDPQADNGGFGLIGMRQRADRIGGQLTITSKSRQGTEVVVKTSL